MNPAAYKIFTHDLRSPIQRGEPVWDGSLPFTLPKVTFDTSSAECGAGWNYCTELPEAFKIAGLWPDGRAAAAYRVEAPAGAVTRGRKSRAASLTITSRVSDREIIAAIEKLSQPFGIHAVRMADEQWAWYKALRSNRRDVEAVEVGLRAALKIRGLDWKLKRFPKAREAREAWAAWGAREAWAARGAWGAWGALEALTVCYAALQGWTKHNPTLLTTGIRDAHQNGLAIATPTGPSELGYAILPPTKEITP